MRKFLAIAIIAMPTIALAQQKAPIAQYWMSVETAAGMNMPGMGGLGGIMAGAMGGQQRAGAGSCCNWVRNARPMRPTRHTKYPPA
ncbi:MAG: hypothetical protein FJY56_19220 [Betaproteobacteria bacterium]|nr:hypothetical protein [Betaproteobacteria bacterium]